MIKYDQSLLQSQSGCKMIELVLDLTRKLREYKSLANVDIAKDEEYVDLLEQVRILKNDHHKALNSMRGFGGKTHYEQRQYMKSEVRRERYNRPL